MTRYEVTELETPLLSILIECNRTRLNIIYLHHWENLNTFPTCTGDITQLKESSSLTMQLPELTSWLTSLGKKKKEFQSFAPCLPGWTSGRFSCCPSGMKVFPKLTVSHPDFFFKVISCSFLTGILPDIPKHLNALSTRTYTPGLLQM